MPDTVSETHTDCLSAVSRDTNNSHLDVVNMAAVAQGPTNPGHLVAHAIPKIDETSVLNLLHGHPSDALQDFLKICCPQPQSVHIILSFRRVWKLFNLNGV
jgi:hypothetical protein